MATKTIYVYENWSSDTPALMGCLYADTLRGKETCSFEYDPDWLKHHAHTFTLDPKLQLYQGRQYAPLDKALFGLFADSCPDRWGRLLMRRREAIMAHREGRKPRLSPLNRTKIRSMTAGSGSFWLPVHRLAGPDRKQP